MSVYVSVNLVIAMVVGGMIAPVWAQDRQHTSLVLNETSTLEVRQDLMVANLYARANSGSSEDAWETVNERMSAAVEKVKTTEGVRHMSTSGHRVFQGGDIAAANPWVAEQDLTIKGKETALLLQLVRTLQEDGLRLRRLGYELTPETRRAVEEKLAAESIEALRARGERVAEMVGMQVGSLETVRVAGTRGGPSNESEMPESEPTVRVAPMPESELVSVTTALELRLTER